MVPGNDRKTLRIIYHLYDLRYLSLCFSWGPLDPEKLRVWPPHPKGLKLCFVAPFQVLGASWLGRWLYTPEN